MSSEQQSVRWTMPGWAAELILQTLKLDSESAAFDPALRIRIAVALKSINRTGVSVGTQPGQAGFDLFRLSKSKAEVDISPNTLRAYNQQGLPFYHRGKAIFVSKAELATFIMYAPYNNTPDIGAEVEA